MQVPLHYHEGHLAAFKVLGRRTLSLLFCVKVVELFRGHGCDILRISGQENAFALACSLWLNYKSLGPFVSYRCQELLHVMGEAISDREKVVIFRQNFLHAHEVPPQHILFREIVHAWEVIRPLVVLHLLQESDGNRAVKPRQIPVAVLAASQVVLEDKLAHLFDHIVVSIPRIHHNLVVMFRGDTCLFTLRSFAPILLIVVFVVIVIQLVARLDTGEPVAIFIVFI